jgi:hypothetical protein
MKTEMSRTDGSQTSDRKKAANKKNAQHSTGPRTPEGKAKSSMNAIKFGFYARAVVMEGEDPQAYDTLREQLWSELSPQNALEAIYTREIIDCHWRLQRQAFIETTVFTRRSVSFTGHQHSAGFAFINDDQGHATLSHLASCEAILFRRLHRAIEQLRKLREDGWRDPNANPCAAEQSGRTGAMPEGDETEVSAKQSLEAQPGPERTTLDRPITPGGPPSTPAASVGPPSPTSASDKPVTPENKGEQPKQSGEGLQPEPADAKPPTADDSPCTPAARVPRGPTISASQYPDTPDMEGPEANENPQGVAV